MDLTNLNLFRNPGPPRRNTDGVLRLLLEPDEPDDEFADDAVAAAPEARPRRLQMAATTVDAALLDLLGELEEWLTTYADRPPARELLAWRSSRPTQPPASAQVIDAGRRALSRQIVDAVPDWNQVRRLTRLVLLLDLLDDRVTSDGELNRADTDRDLVFARLRRRTPLFPRGVSVPVPEPRVQLIRTAKISDLFVVRSEWSCYLRGEIAAITNVLAHERSATTLTLTQEQETTVTEESERIESSERTEEDRTQTEVSREVERAQQLQINVDASVNVSGQYGVTRFAASANAGVNASVSENTRQASKMARDVVSKAVSRVESRLREERVQRTLTRAVDRKHHEIDNDTPTHVRGVYRWVDRVDRYQVFRYPDRLQLEFEIPEPAQYLRYRLALPGPQLPGGISEPPAFNVSPAMVTPATYATHALTFRAGNVPPPPDPSVSVSVGENLAPTSEPPAPASTTAQWASPELGKSLNATIPQGYAAMSAVISASAMPKLANWRVESQPNGSPAGKTDIEGFHHIVLTVAVGGGLATASKNGSAGLERFSVQLTADAQLGSEDRAKNYFGDAVLTSPVAGGPVMTVPFGQPVVDKVSMAVSVSGATSAAVSAEIRCVLRPEALAEWQNTVFDLLLDSWRAWDREWRLQQQETALGPKLSAVDARSPARNLQIITEELRRQVITWLLDDESFAGRDGLLPPTVPPTWQRYSISTARNDAPLIQFLEQGLEWGNLTYVPYPYYWTGGPRWDTLAELEGADPRFVDFLRAGSVRVVVPARPGFELAVLHWLIYQEPFLGDPLPLPDDDLFVSIATEIRDLTQPPAGGEAGDSWEARLPTTLMWLEDEARLPRNEAARLGRPPNEPIDPLCSAALSNDEDDDEDDDHSDDDHDSGDDGPG